MNFSKYLLKLNFILNKNLPVRLISTGKILEGRSYTRESGIRPGSSEATDPQKWAERLYDLQKLSKLDLSKPSQLNMVVLLNKRYSTYYSKAILEKYNMLDLRPSQFQIVKNVPSVNEDLKKISHHIKVVPIKFPHGIPKTVHDFFNAKLLPNGNFILHTGLKVDGRIIDENVLFDESNEKAKELIFLPNKHTQRSLTSFNYTNCNRKDWKSNRFLKEYFYNHYQYKHNQDGKEYRYSKLWRLSDSHKQSMARRYNPDGTIRPNSNLEADWNIYPWKYF